TVDRGALLYGRWERSGPCRAKSTLDDADLDKIGAGVAVPFRRSVEVIAMGAQTPGTMPAVVEPARIERCRHENRIDTTCFQPHPNLGCAEIEVGREIVERIVRRFGIWLGLVDRRHGEGFVVQAEFTPLRPNDPARRRRQRLHRPCGIVAERRWV